MRTLLYLLLIYVHFFAASAIAADSFIVLSYHDVQDGLRGDMNDDQLAVGSEQLAEQFSWLREHGYNVIPVDRVLEAAAGRDTLPEKAVLLTFDDGYRSMYTRVFPLLKLYKYPAVAAVVGRWLEVPEKGSVTYGSNTRVPRSRFLSWDQIREMSQSGLVEIASHTYDLHRGIQGNPQGNFQPAAVTRIYDPKQQRYEAADHYSRRIRSDLRRNNDLIRRQTGRQPRIVVWPYGAYSGKTVEIAKSQGLTVTIGLGDGINGLSDYSRMKRMLLLENPTLDSFVYQIRNLQEEDPRRVVHIDLDYIFDPDPDRTEVNLGKVLDRIKAMKVNTVFLQAFADPDGDGNADALYFPNRHLPVRADLFNRVAWQLKTRSGVGVYAWMPTLSFKIHAPDSWRVQQWHDGKARVSVDDYTRLSPYHPDVRRIVGEIYQDLAAYCNFDGLLFHDDAFLRDDEDVNPLAISDLQKNWGHSGSIRELLDEPGSRTVWTRSKSLALTRFTRYLADQVRMYRPEIKTSRNLYALPLLEPRSEEWFAQSFPQFLANYDYVAVMAMARMENAEDPDTWLLNVVRAARRYPDALKKTVFELQSVDWNTRKKIPSEELVRQMNLLQQNGAIQFGYYPDDVYADHPRLADMKRSISLRTFPYGP